MKIGRLPALALKRRTIASISCHSGDLEHRNSRNGSHGTKKYTNLLIDGMPGQALSVVFILEKKLSRLSVITAVVSSAEAGYSLGTGMFRNSSCPSTSSNRGLP